MRVVPKAGIAAQHHTFVTELGTVRGTTRTLWRMGDISIVAMRGTCAPERGMLIRVLRMNISCLEKSKLCRGVCSIHAAPAESLFQKVRIMPFHTSWLSVNNGFLVPPVEHLDSILRCLVKLSAEATVVIPQWTNTSWFTTAIRACFEYQVLV